MISPHDNPASRTRRKAPAGRAVNLVDSFREAEAKRAAARASSPTLLTDRLGTLFVALSVVIMTFSTLIPVVPIVVFLAIWLAVPLMTSTAVLKPTRGALLVLALPVFCMLSAAWSDHANKSLYFGCAFTSMVLCLVILNRSTSFRAFATGISIGISIGLVIILASNNYRYDPMSGSYSLMGYFGSKNMVGFVAQIGFIAGMSMLFMPLGRWRHLVLSICPIVLSLICLELSKSGTSQLALLASIAGVLIMLGILRLPRSLRIAASSIAVLVAITAAGWFITSGGQGIVLESMGKDKTLTGRTYLWQQGIETALERPVLGYGYSAFWVEGQPRAERYWFHFNIESREGFHFHNSYIHAFVDIGGIGLMLVVLIMLVNQGGSLVALVRTNGRSPEAIFLFAVTIGFLVRSFAEVDTLGPFGMGAMMYYSIIPRLEAMRATSSRERTANAHPDRLP